jgi:nucleotide-binding universal stress UspA family protein
MTPDRPRILVATNGSPSARRAIAVAADLASTFNAKLFVLHVVSPVEHRVGRLMPTLPVTRRLDDPHSSPVLAEARQLAWTRGVAAEPILVAGEAPSTIVGLAQDLGADLLVIGSQRRLAPAVLVARTRHWVQTHARCPVLEVPVDRPTPARPATQPALVN